MPKKPSSRKKGSASKKAKRRTGKGRSLACSARAARDFGTPSIESPQEWPAPPPKKKGKEGE